MAVIILKRHVCVNDCLYVVVYREIIIPLSLQMPAKGLRQHPFCIVL